jgi:hypothetical protein
LHHLYQPVSLPAGHQSDKAWVSRPGEDDIEAGDDKIRSDADDKSTLLKTDGPAEMQFRDRGISKIRPWKYHLFFDIAKKMI